MSFSGNVARAIVLAWLLATASVRAEVFCATTSSEFQAALDAAAINGEHDHVRLATGTFQAPGGGFLYNPAGAIGGDSMNLAISGAWTEFFGNPCGQQLQLDPTLTVIDGGGTEHGLSAYLRQTGDFSVRHVTFLSGYVGSLARGGGLVIQPLNPYNGVIDVESNHFIANEADSGGAMHVYFEHGAQSQLRVINNLFTANHARSLVGAVEIVVNSPVVAIGAETQGLSPVPAISFINNTVVGNTVGSINELTVGGIWISGDVPAKWVVNNNLWNNDGADMRVVPGTTQGYRLWNNNIQEWFGSTPEFMENNISVEPQYVSCGVFCPHRQPLGSSPLVDGGVEPLSSAYPWSLPATDAAGSPRLREAHVDIGAYENQTRIFNDRFEQ